MRGFQKLLGRGGDGRTTDPCTDVTFEQRSAPLATAAELGVSVRSSDKITQAAFDRRLPSFTILNLQNITISHHHQRRYALIPTRYGLLSIYRKHFSAGCFPTEQEAQAAQTAYRRERDPDERCGQSASCAAANWGCKDARRRWRSCIRRNTRLVRCRSITFAQHTEIKTQGRRVPTRITSQGDRCGTEPGPQR